MEHRLDIDPLLRNYCESYSTQESDRLKDLERWTNLNTVKRLDASDTIQGRLISFISHLVRPKVILEIGTFTGYATGCLAEGLAQGGKIISIERKDVLKDRVVQNLKLLGISEKVDLRFGNALEILPTIEEEIDLVFIDAAKHEYQEYFDRTIDNVRSGGVIIVDNTLWKARVTAELKDRMTQSVHNFNVAISKDKRIEVMLLPYRDGVSLIRKL